MKDRASLDEVIIDRFGRVGVPMKIGPNNLIFVEVEIDNYVIPAYLDTGASHAFLDSRAYEALKGKSDRIAALGLTPVSAAPVQCSNGSEMAIIGKFKTTMHIDDLELTGELQVVQGQPIPLLVGGDVMIASEVCIDYKRGLLFANPSASWIGGRIPTIRESNCARCKERYAPECEPLAAESAVSEKRDHPAAISPSRTPSPALRKGSTKSERKPRRKVVFADEVGGILADSEPASSPAAKIPTPPAVSAADLRSHFTLTLQTNYVVPRHSQSTIWLRVPEVLVESNECVMLEPNEMKLAKRGLLATSVVSRVTGNRAALLVVNMTSNPVTLFKGAQLATLVTVTECDRSVISRPRIDRSR